MSSNRRQGDRFERDVADRLHSHGFFVSRTAGSGTADREAVDIVAMSEYAVLLIECKTYHGDYEGELIDFDEEQLKEVEERATGGNITAPHGHDVVACVVVDCADGGVVQYYSGSESPFRTVEDTRPFYTLMERYSND